MAETRQETLTRLFPAEIDAGKRPEEPIPTDWPFHLDFPQFIANDDNWYEQENAFLRQLFSNDKIMNALIEGIKDQLASCDLRIVTEVLKGLMSPDMLKKLNGIEVGALNNPHPPNHPASMITQDGAHRFVSDTEKTTWSGKADASHGQHTPAKETANNARFLRNDATWQTVTPDNIGAYAKSESVGAFTNLPQTANWDNYITPGYYGVAQNQDFSANYGQPVGAYRYGVLAVIRGGNGLAQVYYSHDNEQIWHRSGYDNGRWNPWRRLFANGVATTATNAYAVLPQGNKNVIDLSTTYPVGVSAHKIYNGGGPVSYGNLLTIRGDNNGAGQFLLEWRGVSGQLGKLFYRCARDSAPDIWSGWGTIAYTDSPELTGKPTVPTAETTASDKRIANTEFVKTAIAAAGSGIVAESLGVNGYRKFADGFIEQWGFTYYGNKQYANHTIAFPLAFPTECFTVTGNTYRTELGAANSGSNFIRAKTRTGFNFLRDGEGILWRAVGR